MTKQLRRIGLALGIALAGGLWAVQPAAAQERFQVLVVRFTPDQGARGGFGEDVAEELRELIEDMPTHQPVEEDALEDALDRYDLEEEDLNCVRGQQLAIQMSVPLVMCGTYTPQNQVTARVIGAATGETFEVPAFQASNPGQAAQQVFSSFQNYVEVLRFAVFCRDYMQQQNYASALEQCNRALAIAPDLVSANYMKGRALMEMDSLRQALAQFQKVLELSPAEQDAMLSAGIVSAKLNEKEQAREYFQDYLELNPGNVDVRLQVATDLANAGDPEGALRIAQEGLQMDTTGNLVLQQYIGDFALNAAMQVREGGANGEPADSARANELFRTALDAYRAVFQVKADSADPRMLRNMLNVLVQLDRNQEAVELGREIVQLKADDPQVWFTYANALQKTGNTAEAIEALRRVTQLDPTNTNAFKAMAVYLVQADRLGEAQRVINDALAQVDASQRDALSDDLARAIFAEGYNNKYKQGQSAAARQYWQVARELATTAATRSMIDFWRGFSLYEQARAVQEPNTAASAREALPMFQEAKRLIQSGADYARTQPSIPLQQVLDAIDQFIEIQELLIRRGR